MSIQKITPDLIETFTLVTNPQRYYSSASNGQVSGSVYVFARRSDSEKDVVPSSIFTDAAVNDVNLESLLRSIKFSASGTAVNISRGMNAYLEAVHSQSISARKHKALDIVRFTPSYTFTKNTQRKSLVKNTLFSYCRTVDPTLHWAWTNYHSLNFFMSSFPNEIARTLLV